MLKPIKIGNLTTTDYITDGREFNVLHINEKWEATVQIKANKILVDDSFIFKSGRYDIVFICGEKIITEEVYVYDEDSIN